MMPRKDPEARKAYHREYMRRRYVEDPTHKAAHIARIRANDKRSRNDLKKLIAAFKQDGCKVCGETEFVCLSAHHVNSDEKEFNIGDATSGKIGRKKVIEELSKCVCLCHNCHAKVHAGIIVAEWRSGISSPS